MEEGTMEMSSEFDFKDLVVFDVANNHQGSLEHGMNIIRAMGAAARKNNARAAVKFQFRDLDTFVHSAQRESSENRHVGRFLSTRLAWDEYRQLRECVREEKMLAMCTPFDESSVDHIVRMDFDIIKIASCSATDWPLIEKVSATGRPVIASTGGLSIDQIDDLNSFFVHRGVDFALMHCVAIYPTPEDMLNLNQIELLRARYPHTAIGWSTHEDPDSLEPVQIAIAKGAQLLERHVGLETEDITLNGYSSSPDQVERWLNAANQARRMLGPRARPRSPEQESAALATLQRGVFVSEKVPPGTTLSDDMIYFAFPLQKGQLSSGEWKQGIKTSSAIESDGAVLTEAVEIPAPRPEQIIKKAIHEVKAMLNEARVHLNTDFAIEYSHHYGIEKFREVGAVLIDIVNREYCKKIIVQLPGQVHPQHYHKRKEETFQVLHGQLNVIIEGRKRILFPGDTCLVQPGMWHSFWTETGCVFEEISTRHFNDDSFYKDKKINEGGRAARKTLVNHWGRYELPDKLAEKAALAADSNNTAA